MNQRLERIDGLHSMLRTPARRMIQMCEEKLKRTLLVVHCWRSVASQLAIYQEGRTYNRESGEWDVTNPQGIKTNAKPGQSAHNIVTRIGDPAALALDVIPFHEDGSIDWNPLEAFCEDLYDLAWKCGLDPLGDPIGAYLKADRLHFEEPGWKYKIDGLALVMPTNDLATL